jgi:hypothetical protein
MNSQHIDCQYGYTSLHPSVVGGGELISGDGSDGPFLGASKGVQGQGDVGQVLFHLWEEKKSQLVGNLVSRSGEEALISDPH